MSDGRRSRPIGRVIGGLSLAAALAGPALPEEPYLEASVHIVDKCTGELIEGLSELEIKYGRQEHHRQEVYEEEFGPAGEVEYRPGDKIRAQPYDANYYRSSWVSCRQKIVVLEVERKARGTVDGLRPGEPIEEVARLFSAALHGVFLSLQFRAGTEEARFPCAQALRDLKTAIRLQSRPSQARINLWGRRLERYLPYYYQGVCRFQTGDYEGALSSFARSLAERQICFGRRDELDRLRRLKAKCEEQDGDPSGSEATARGSRVAAFEPEPRRGGLP